MSPPVRARICRGCTETPVGQAPLLVRCRPRSSRRSDDREAPGRLTALGGPVRFGLLDEVPASQEHGQRVAAHRSFRPPRPLRVDMEVRLALRLPRRPAESREAGRSDPTSSPAGTRSPTPAEESAHELCVEQRGHDGAPRSGRVTSGGLPPLWKACARLSSGPCSPRPSKGWWSSTPR